MSADRRPCALAIVAKMPAAGRCKTRLVPPLTFDQAATLSRCFLIDTAHNVSDVASKCGAIPVGVYTPAASEEARDAIFGRAFCYVRQRGDDFGQRLCNAVTDLFESGFGSVCLIDSDSPTLPPAYLALAVERLKLPGERVVIGPATDGGYYLIGLKRPTPELFHGIAWSTSEVFEQTRKRARAAGISTDVLPSWYDVDDGFGLEKLKEELRVLPTAQAYAADATRAFLGIPEQRDGSRSRYAIVAGGPA